MGCELSIPPSRLPRASQGPCRGASRGRNRRPLPLQHSNLQSFQPVNVFCPIPFSLNRLRTLFPSTAHHGTCIPFLFFHLQTLCRHNGGGVQRHSSQRINMIEKTDNSISLNELSLCRHRTVSGRRCRLRVLNAESHLCFRHAQLRQKKRHAEDLACDLAGQLTEFTFAADINSFLSRLLLLEAHDRIAPRRAAVMEDDLSDGVANAARAANNNQFLPAKFGSH